MSLGFHRTKAKQHMGTSSILSKLRHSQNEDAATILSNDTTGIHWLRLETSRHPQLLRLDEALKESLSIFTLLDLRNLYRSEIPEDRILAILGYATIYDGFWGAITKDYATSLSDERPAVRRAVLTGMAEIKWREFIPILRAAAESEDEPELLSNINQLVQALEEHGTFGIHEMF